ncbi:MAG: diguanylate cyclase [Acidobacteriia bacterium]|nr:diguanylate cyclase [Terriglobia bacterium]
MRTLSLPARLFVAFVVLAGAVAFSLSLAPWPSAMTGKFLVFLALALIASGMKVALPLLNSTMSVNFPFILLGLVALAPEQTMILGCASVMVQCFVRVKKGFSIIQILFNTANVAIAIWCANGVFRAGWLEPYPAGLRLFAAATAYFIVNSLCVAAILSLSEGRSRINIWKELFLWSFPYHLMGASVALAISSLMEITSWIVILLIVPVAYGIYAAYGAYFGRLEDQITHTTEVASLHLRTIEALALAIDVKDHTTHEHLNRVRVYACDLAERLGLPANEQEAVRAASLLHDIGKLAVPEHIISKPGKLTHEEFEKMKIHPVVGAEILGRVKFPYPVVPIVRSHHEKWDGTGYPDGLKGEQIPIGARIISAVDCLDALASDRPYRPAVPLEKAMDMVREQSGKAFDPVVVELLSKHFRQLEAKARQAGNATDALNTNAVVERGHSPAAGFAAEARPLVEPGKVSFLDAIASARQEAQTLYELSHELNTSLRLKETLRIFQARLQTLIPFDSMALFLQNGNLLEPKFVSGIDQKWLSSLRVPAGEGMVGWVLYNRKPIMNGNPAVEPVRPDEPVESTVLRSAIAVPLEGLKGMRGVLAFYSRYQDSFCRDHLRVLMAISSKAALAVENSLYLQQVENSATTDFLTGLPNARSLFLHLDSEITRAQRENRPVTVLVCDLNDFKPINDRFGHLEGNEVLRKIAACLRNSCREYDYVARMGGDEFVLVLPGLGPGDADERMAHIGALIEATANNHPSAAGLSASLGKATYPDDGESAEDILGEADRSMYRAKRLRYNTRLRDGSESDSTTPATAIQ